MKALTLTILAFAIATPAFAAHKAKPATLKQVKSDAQEFLPIFESQTEECDYRVKETRNGITISVKKDKAPVVYLDVSSDSEITVVGETSPDDSYGRTYNIKGEGKIEFVHVDDAYDHLYITKDGKTTSCELDY